MHNNRTRYLVRLGATIAAVATSCAITVPATAATYGPATPGSNYADSLWGGYVARGSGLTTITGSWVQPQVTCTSTSDLYAPWVGIDGYGSETVEQTGVETSCGSGHALNRPWFEMYPDPPQYWNDTVQSGDHMTGTVTYTGSGSYSITLTDDTRGWSEHVTRRANAQNVSAEAVIESPTHSYPRFSSLRFSNITVNGQVFDRYDPQPLTSGGYRPGPLSDGSYTMAPGYSYPRTQQVVTTGQVRY